MDQVATNKPKSSVKVLISSWQIFGLILWPVMVYTNSVSNEYLDLSYKGTITLFLLNRIRILIVTRFRYFKQLENGLVRMDKHWNYRTFTIQSVEKMRHGYKIWTEDGKVIKASYSYAMNNDKLDQFMEKWTHDSDHFVEPDANIE